MNLPNKLTVLRIILVPIYLIVFYSDLERRLTWALLIFILAGLTDALDGYIARKYNLITELGKVLDPLADKLMMFAVLISLASSDLIPSWIIYMLILKEIVMILGGGILFLFKGNQVVPSNIYGKIATICFYVATFVTLVNQGSRISEFLFFATLIFNIIAFINYLVIYLSVRNKNQEEIN